MMLTFSAQTKATTSRLARAACCLTCSRHSTATFSTLLMLWMISSWCTTIRTKGVEEEDTEDENEEDDVSFIE
eukprot:480144-Rhodomonas_salina.2